MMTVQFPREPDDKLYEYLAEKARVCGGGADDIWEGLCARFGSPVEKLGLSTGDVTTAIHSVAGFPGVTGDHVRRLAWLLNESLRPAPDSAPAGYKPCSPELLESGVDCATAPRWSAKEWDGHSHWHPAPRGEPVAWAWVDEKGEHGVTLRWDVAKHLPYFVKPLYAEPPAPQKYDDTLLPFLALMRAELHANSHKGDREGWLRMTLEQALDEIRHHGDKLIVPVMNQDREAIREHAADVANCAMMLADIAGVLTRE